MISCIIVAGGRSERFGKDKKNVKFNGKTFLENVLEKATQFSDEIIVSLGKDDTVEDLVEKEGLKLAFDGKKWKGPLEGICSSVSLCQGGYVVILSVDSPMISPDIFQEMVKTCQKHDAVIPLHADGRLEVLHAAYNTSKLKHACKKTMETEEHSVKSMTSYLENIKLVDIGDFRKYDRNLLTFFNVNTKKDLEQLIKLEKEG